jgi:hypothetical protein
MKISIAGHGSQAQFSVKDFLEKHPKQWSAVIINASGEKLPSYVEELAIEHFNVQFDDVVYSLGHTQPPEKSHVEQILTWCKGKEDIVFAIADEAGKEEIIIGFDQEGLTKSLGL